MAKGKKTGGRDFKPGNKLSKGRAPIPQDLREAREANRVQFLALAHRFLTMTREELKLILANPKTTTMELMVGTIISKAITQGDHARLSFLLDRTIGKEVEKVDITHRMGLLALIKTLEEETD